MEHSLVGATDAGRRLDARPRAVALVLCCLGLGLGLVAVTARPAAAGIVNVQSVLSAEAEEGLSGSVTGAADWRTGNTERLVFGLAPVMRYRTGDHLMLAYGSGEYDDNSDIAKVFGHARYRQALSERITGELFTQAEYDEKRALALRTLVGAGPLFHIFRRDDLRLSWGVAYMLEYEEIAEDQLDPRPPGDADPGLQHRISSYLTGHYALADNLQLVETIYVQPRITDPADDVRLLNDSSLQITISRHLSFNTTFSLAYDTAPPPTKDEVDTTLQSSITYQF